MQYTSNSTVGILVAGGNGAGMNETQLNNPRGLYFDPSTNSLLIANYGANNIVRWVIGDSNWTLVAGNINGTSGSGSTRFSSPSDVISDSMGNIYVADRFNHRVQFFSAGQTNGTTIAGISTQYGNTSMTLNQPPSIALDSQFNLYVSDTVNDRVQQFTRY
jgi:DNA-binding beta-propeller fold protein YncE